MPHSNEKKYQEYLELVSPKKPNRGKVRQKHGDEAEQVIEKMLNGEYGCNFAGLGVLHKRHALITINEKGERIYKAPAGVDFTGHLKGGRACYIEVKFTSDQQLDLKILTEDQIKELDRALQDGACCALCVVHGETPKHPQARVSAIPWHVVKHAQKLGYKYLDLDYLEAWLLPSNTLLLNHKAFKEEVQPWAK